MPPQTPDAQQRAAGRCGRARADAAGRGPADSYIDRSIYDRCITRGIAGSMTPIIYNYGNQIVQGPGWVGAAQEMIHETRVIPLDGRPRVASAHHVVHGRRRAGHWEGDTLVVETTDLQRPDVGHRGERGGARPSTDVKIIERFTRVAPRRSIAR